ncbi:hypothetical protein SUDANB23_00131 [Streptomyces sp. enrichment culture]
MRDGRGAQAGFRGAGVAGGRQRDVEGGEALGRAVGSAHLSRGETQARTCDGLTPRHVIVMDTPYP